MRIADTTLELEFVKVINGFQRPVYNKIQKKYIIMDSFSFIMFTIFIPLREIQEKKKKDGPDIAREYQKIAEYRSV